jgi:hypothetical protein
MFTDAKEHQEHKNMVLNLEPPQGKYIALHLLLWDVLWGFQIKGKDTEVCILVTISEMYCPCIFCLPSIDSIFIEIPYIKPDDDV